MAYVPVTINGVAYPKTKEAGAKPYPVTIVGYAWITGLEVGGGPIFPPEMGEPPGIWGPTDPFPGYGLPESPPGFWGPNDPRPGWGLPPVEEPPPVQPPSGAIKPFPPEGGWGYSARTGWVWKPKEGTASPKK